MKFNSFFILIFWLFPFFGQAQSDWIEQHLNGDFYKNQFTGFVLYDPMTKEYLENINGEKYFTPASNVKILTLYGAMKSLPDSIPALRYEKINGDLYIEGLGDPTFLHPEFKDFNHILDWLKIQEGNIYLYWGKYEGDRMGLGWSWEDYEKYYSVEKSEFPINENTVTIKRTKSKPEVFPMTLADSVQIQEGLYSREFYKNKFYFGSKDGKKTQIPFVVKDELIRQILSELTCREIRLTDKSPSKSSKILFSVPSDLVYKRMMEVSDNFLAEQILLMISEQQTNTMNTEKAINYIQTRYLKGIPQKPVWVDGSGLSRYNLFSPVDIVFVLEKLYSEFPKERLFNIFAIGGKTGTLKSNYGGKTDYVYAKSGTLTNNYSLSGYLITKSGRTLIFSIMNNHYVSENWQIRKETQALLEYIRDHY